MRQHAVVLFVTLTVVSTAPSLTSTVKGQGEVPFEEAQLFFELNDTDGDLGIHASIDGGPWVSLTIEGPGDLRLLDIVSRAALRRQGMTQLSFESAEPSFDELAPAAFFRRFPEGRYEIEGLAQSGERLENTTRLSHVMPAAPGNIRLSGVPAAESCDATPLPSVNAPASSTGIPSRHLTRRSAKAVRSGLCATSCSSKRRGASPSASIYPLRSLASPFRAESRIWQGTSNSRSLRVRRTATTPLSRAAFG
jgi:hypothetical protein